MYSKTIGLFKGRLQSIRSYLVRSSLNTSFAPNPKVIYLAVNGVCNLRCKMCDIGQRHPDSQFYRIMNPTDGIELRLQRLKDLIEEVKYFRPRIAVTSTEPLLYKDLIPFCNFVISKGLEVQITTNGFLLERVAEDLVEIGVHALWVSLDGPPEVHDLVRGVDRAFERAYEGLIRVESSKKRYGKRFPDIFINYTITNYNDHCLDRFIEAIQEIKVERVVFSHMNYVTNRMAEEHNRLFGDLYPATPSSIASANPESVNTEILTGQIKNIKKQYSQKCSFSPDLDEKDLIAYYHNSKRFLKGNKCLVPWQAAQIIANGDCVTMTRCFNISFGNIHEMSFSQIWNGERYQDFRKHLLEYGSFPACSRCCGIL